MPDLSVPTRLAAFAAALALTFGGAVALGSVVDPTETAPRSDGHGASAGDGHGSGTAGAGGSDVEDDHGADGDHADTGAHADGDHADAGAPTDDAGEADQADPGGAEHGAHEASAETAGLSSVQDGYRLVAGRTRAVAGRPGILRFRIEGPDGRPVRSGYELESERELHLIVVRRDGIGFQHLHPRRSADGTWSTPLTLPSGGSHRVLADFVVGGTRRTLGVDLEASGVYRPAPPATPARTAGVDGYRVTLDGAPRVGRESTLRFRVTRDGRAVTGLQPYLGARGHLVALREGDLAYLHVHPTEGEGHGGAHDDAGAAHGHEPTGTVGFAATFPAAGPHRLYFQFRTGGVVRTAPFVIEVAR